MQMISRTEVHSKAFNLGCSLPRMGNRGSLLSKNSLTANWAGALAGSDYAPRSAGLRVKATAKSQKVLQCLHGRWLSWDSSISTLGGIRHNGTFDTCSLESFQHRAQFQPSLFMAIWTQMTWQGFTWMLGAIEILQAAALGWGGVMRLAAGEGKFSPAPYSRMRPTMQQLCFLRIVPELQPPPLDGIGLRDSRILLLTAGLAFCTNSIC